MAHIVCNIALGRIGELYRRVENGDPSTARLVLIPLETSGLASDATLKDYDTVADLLAGSTNEQTTMSRKTLSATELASVPTPDDGNDRVDYALPAVTWTAAAGNPVSKVLVCYEPNNSSPSDSNKIPLTIFDATLNPDGNDATLNSGTFFRAS